MVHGQQVVFPLRVHDLQHDHALVLSHALGAPYCLAFLIAFADDLFEVITKPIEQLGTEIQFVLAQVNPEAASEFVAKPFRIPLVRILIFWAVSGDQPVHNTIHRVSDFVLLVLPLQ